MKKSPKKIRKSHFFLGPVEILSNERYLNKSHFPVQKGSISSIFLGRSASDPSSVSFQSPCPFFSGLKHDIFLFLGALTPLLLSGLSQRIVSKDHIPVICNSLSSSSSLFKSVVYNVN
jgi:hypothetical protein